MRGTVVSELINDFKPESTVNTLYAKMQFCGIFQSRFINTESKTGHIWPTINFSLLQASS